MTKVVGGDEALDMTIWDLQSITYGTVQSHSATSLTIVDGEYEWDLKGTNLGGYDSYGIPHSGVLTGLTFKYAGFALVTISQGHIPVNAMAADIFSNDVAGFEKQLFKGNDSFVGTKSADKILGYAGKDSIDGGAGNDVLWGGTGADHLTGGSGHNTFVYDQASESSATKFDTINGFNAIADKISTADYVGGVGKEIRAGHLAAGSFNADLTKWVDAHHFAAGDAVLFKPSSGGYAGDLFLLVDLNGRAGYQSGHDLVIRLDHASHLSHFGAHDFS